MSCRPATRLRQRVYRALGLINADFRGLWGKARVSRERVYSIACLVRTVCACSYCSALSEAKTTKSHFVIQLTAKLMKIFAILQLCRSLGMSNSLLNTSRCLLKTVEGRNSRNLRRLIPTTYSRIISEAGNGIESKYV
jgi:hypothetical protein